MSINVTEAPDAKWKSKLKAPDHLHPELRRQHVLGGRDEDADADVHPEWSTMLLCPEALHPHADEPGQCAVDVCKRCQRSLRSVSVRPPKESIANGNWRGSASKVPELAAVEPHVSLPRPTCAALPPPPARPDVRLRDFPRSWHRGPSLWIQIRPPDHDLGFTCRCGLFFDRALRDRSRVFDFLMTRTCLQHQEPAG